MRATSVWAAWSGVFCEPQLSVAADALHQLGDLFQIFDDHQEFIEGDIVGRSARYASNFSTFFLRSSIACSISLELPDG